MGRRRSLLTPRECEMLTLFANGLAVTNHDLAVVMECSEQTVRTHMQNCLVKLKVVSRSAAVAWAWRHGEIAEDEDGNRKVTLRPELMRGEEV